MKILLILIVVVAVMLVLKACVGANQAAKDNPLPPAAAKPIALVENDKIIFVSNINAEDIKKALIDFCNIYNKEKYIAIPRLTTRSPNSFVVTFPFDTDFVTFCYAVNYLKYPIDIKVLPIVTAWATTKEGEDWITDKSKNKKVMLFLADDDNEFDNVFMTTEDNIGYKLGFAIGKEKQLLKAPKELYRPQAIGVNDLTDLPFVDIE
jgi:hypothetical protein